MKNVILIILSLFSFPAFLFASDYYFYVQFADKNNSPFSVENPLEYLSADAVARRQRMNITIDTTDFPPNPLYVEQVKNFVRIVGQSRWLNGLTVALNDSSLITSVDTLPFVDFIKYTGKRNTPNQPAAQNQKIEMPSSAATSNSAAFQLQQIKADYLHSIDYRGQGIKIAVLDGGFSNVDINPAFDSLRLQGRLLGARDFSDFNPNVYEGNYHGANVLSIMAGNLPDRYLGSAPDAQYLLLASEYVPTEQEMETDFWVSAAEYADSSGVDLITTSLGYCKFFNYADMDGETSRASRAAGMASEKGIIVCASAGNEGLHTWHYIDSPADAKGIITVGAVTASGSMSEFSSFGPTADGRVKPEIAAMGTNVSLVNNRGEVTTDGNSGTSYSTPLAAGALASLLQYVKANFQTYSVAEILDAIFRSGNTYDTPTAQGGYGIPDFQIALENINNTLTATLNPKKDKKRLLFSLNGKTLKIADNVADSEVQIFSLEGKTVYCGNNVKGEILLENLKNGFYILRLKGKDFICTEKIIKN